MSGEGEATQRDENTNLTLTELNDYIASLKQWIEQVGNQERQFVNANVYATQNWEENVYRRLGYSLQVIPPLWKRLIAEVIDFIILFALKLYLTFAIFYNLELPIPDKDNFISFFDSPRKAVEMSTEFALLELLYRVTACLFETYWLHGAEAATPGKLCMGLRVVYVEDVVEINNPNYNYVCVYPGTQLGWKKAFYRALLKNILLGIIMFPMCFGLLLSKQNRTGYDLLIGTLVIEHRPHHNIQANQPNQGLNN